MRVPAGRSCRSSQNVILSRSGTNLRWRGQRRDQSDRREKILAGTYRFECLPQGEGGPLVSSNKPPEFNVEMIGRNKEGLGLGRACLGAREVTISLPNLGPIIDTVEVRGSSPLVPTISFNDLASLTSLREAPNGSIKRAHPEGMMFHTSSNPTSAEFWAAHFYGTGVLRQIDSEQASFRVARDPPRIRTQPARVVSAIACFSTGIQRPAQSEEVVGLLSPNGRPSVESRSPLAGYAPLIHRALAWSCTSGYSRPSPGATAPAIVPRGWRRPDCRGTDSLRAVVKDRSAKPNRQTPLARPEFEAERST